MVAIIHVICRRGYSVHRTVTSVMVQMMEVCFARRKLGFIPRSHRALYVRITHQKRAHVLHFLVALKTLFPSSLVLHNFYAIFLTNFMKNILTCFLLHNFSLKYFLQFYFISIFQFYFFNFISRYFLHFIKKSSNQNRFTVTRAPQKHVRPTHLGDDKYLIKFSFSPLFPFQHFLPVLKSKSLEQQASAYLFSFNTQTHGPAAGCVYCVLCTVCVCVCVHGSLALRAEQKWNKKEFFSC